MCFSFMALGYLRFACRSHLLQLHQTNSVPIGEKSMPLCFGPTLNRRPNPRYDLSLTDCCRNIFFLHAASIDLICNIPLGTRVSSPALPSADSLIGCMGFNDVKQ